MRGREGPGDGRDIRGGIVRPVTRDSGMLQRLGRYVIEKPIGKGGMGVVYRALDERLGKTVAIKVLSQSEDVSPDAGGRFRQEARAAAVLTHPAIATALDYDEHEGFTYIVYEYVEGRTLDLLIADRAISPDQITDLAGQVASGLAYAHERGILHRDIKPQNIMVTTEGRVKILDFGLAKRTRLAFHRADGTMLDTTAVETAAGTIVGTVQYMSPEQIAGESLDGRTDIFSLGVVLYELASGENPFRGETFGSTVGKILSREPPPLKVTSGSVPGLQEIILKCLAKNRDLRYPSARSLVADLEQLREGRSAKSIPADASDAASPIPRGIARVSLMLLQVLYLCIYGFALYYHQDVYDSLAKGLASDAVRSWSGVSGSALFWTSVVLVSACCGIAVRLYITASVAFDAADTGRQLRRLFPFLLAFDEAWALSPLLLLDRWRAGVTLICLTVMAYLPFSHRNLIWSAYPKRRARHSGRLETSG